MNTRSPSEQHDLLRTVGSYVRLSTDKIEVTLDQAALLHEFGTCDAADQPGRVTFSIPAALTRRGCELRLVYPATDHGAPRRIEPRLVKLIAEAEQAHALLVEHGPNLDAIKRGQVTRLARLKFLAPEIVSAILDGRQPTTLTRLSLIRAASIPLDWREQRRVLGFG